MYLYEENSQNFWNLKNSKKRVKKVYPYEENSQT